MKKPKRLKDIDAVYVIVRPRVPGPWVLLRSQANKETIGTRLERRPLSNEERTRYMPPALTASVIRERKAAKARQIAHAKKHGATYRSRYTPPARAA